MPQPLTQTERRALNIIKSGGGYPEIASQLAMSTALARATVTRIVAKTGAKSWDEIKAVQV